MKSVHAGCVLASVALLVGCTEVTYQVKIINNGSFTTDFAIESNDSTTTFVQDLAPGKSTTVSHTATTFVTGTDRVTVSSGTLIGNEITPIDAQCTAAATSNDLLTVVKALDGTLSCTVTEARQAGSDKPARKGK